MAESRKLLANINCSKCRAGQGTEIRIIQRGHKLSFRGSELMRGKHLNKYSHVYIVSSHSNLPNIGITTYVRIPIVLMDTPNKAHPI